MHQRMFGCVCVVVIGEWLDVLLQETTGLAVDVDVQLIVLQTRANAGELVDASPVDGAGALKVRTSRARKDVASVAAAGEDQLFVIAHLVHGY